MKRPFAAMFVLAGGLFFAASVQAQQRVYFVDATQATSTRDSTVRVIQARPLVYPAASPRAAAAVRTVAPMPRVQQVIKRGRVVDNDPPRASDATRGWRVRSVDRADDSAARRQALQDRRQRAQALAYEQQRRAAYLAHQREWEFREHARIASSYTSIAPRDDRLIAGSVYYRYDRPPSYGQGYATFGRPGFYPHPYSYERGYYPGYRYRPTYGYPHYQGYGYGACSSWGITINLRF